MAINFFSVYEAPYMIGVMAKKILIQSHDPKMHVQNIKLEQIKLLSRTKTLT